MNNISRTFSLAGRQNALPVANQPRTKPLKKGRESPVTSKKCRQVDTRAGASLCHRNQGVCAGL